tara:strand:- start:832 stop:1053 length:222 start_codon:yes stop_codon:yes gene_type:complete
MTTIDNKYIYSLLAIVITWFSISLYKRSLKETLDYTFNAKISILAGVVVFAATHLSMQQYEETTMDANIPFNS